jgi:hypothetical protein
MAPHTSYSQGIIKGQPRKFRCGHANRKQRDFTGPNPSGICQCGCGGKTSLARYTDPTRGCVRGQPKRYIHNHHPEPYPPETGYKIEDRGFETPCWTWQRWKNKKGGYGFFTKNRKPVAAHRYFYAKYVRPILPGQQVHHRCHVTCCVNPDHLQAVTQTYNERHKKKMKLSMEKARTIRQLFNWGANVEDICHVFRVNNYLILAVLQNKIWKEGVD